MMKIPAALIRLSLIGLFLLAVAARTAEFGKLDYPYFAGESAVHYRHAYMVNQKGRLPEQDRRASWPDGYSPARVEPAGVEYLTGYAIRIVGYFSEMSERDIAGAFTAFFYSLLVLLIYGVTYNVWGCRAGALFSALLTAFSLPLVKSTSGLEYSHLPFAATTVFLHVFLLQEYLRKEKPITLALLFISTFALFSFWEGAVYYTAVVSIYLTTRRALRRVHGVALLSIMVLAFIAAAAVLPFVHAARLEFSAAACIMYASLGGFVLAGRRWTPKLRALYMSIGALLLWIFLAPLRSGADVASPGISYLLYRLRFAAGKPADPTILPGEVRAEWDLNGSYPAPFELLSLLLPLVLLLPAVVDGIRCMGGVAKRRGAFLVFAASLLFAAFLLDSSLIVFAAPVLFASTAPAFHSFSKRAARRIAFVLVAPLLVLLQLVDAGGALDLTGRLAGLAGVRKEDPRRFVWISIGNADLDLVRFLVSRTSVREPILASPRISPLILTFAGRTTVVVPGIRSRPIMEKTSRMLARFYGSEEELYEECRKTGIKYVLYSVDLSMNETPYSARYMAGVKKLAEESVAFQMHFFPETLEHFELIYENDNHRVFKVREKAGPIFLSDHPPVYDYEVYKRFGKPGPFYDEVIRALSLYALAGDAYRKGRSQEAVVLYSRSLEAFPRFTAASVSLGRVLLALERYQEAYTAFRSVFSYAPDNHDALMGASISLYRLGRLEEARKLLNILISSTADRDILRKARGLRHRILDDIEKKGPG